MSTWAMYSRKQKPSRNQETHINKTQDTLKIPKPGYNPTTRTNQTKWRNKEEMETMRTPTQTRKPNT